MDQDFSRQRLADTTADSIIRYLTLDLFGMDWRDCFPVQLDSETSIQFSDYKTGLEFINRYYSDVYRQSQENSAFKPEEFTERKLRYYKIAGDFFSFHSKSERVGVFIGTPVDWNTYYFRSCFILPAHQNGGKYQALAEHLAKVLREVGVTRIEADIDPSNSRSIHVHNKLKFKFTGFRVSERWGAMLHMTRFLNSETERKFTGQFCHGV